MTTVHITNKNSKSSIITNNIIHNRRILDELADSTYYGHYNKAYERMTTLQKAVFFLLELGFDREWVREHFEFSKQSFYKILRRIGQKIKEYEELDYDL